MGQCVFHWQKNRQQKGGCRSQSDSALWWPYGALWFLVQRQSEFLIANYLPAMRETWVQSLGWEDPLEKGKATHSVFWPGEFHGLYSPWGHKELDTTEELSLHFDLWTRETVAH